MAVGERPQERMERFGVSALSDTELLAMLFAAAPGARTSSPWRRVWSPKPDPSPA